jgi:hypothetical protein
MRSLGVEGGGGLVAGAREADDDADALEHVAARALHLAEVLDARRMRTECHTTEG